MTELIWDGKYDQDGKKVAPLRVALPFQTVETVNESAQERQRMLDMFSAGRDPEWRNRLIWGDKKYVLPALLQEFAGKVDLVYIDPPFDTGADFSFHVDVDGEDFIREPSVIELKAYRDTWGRGMDSYLQWLHDALEMLRELLSEQGSLYMHLDYHVGAYGKVVADEVFGKERLLNEIIWKRTSARSDSHTFNHIHDCIYLYSKSELYKFNEQFIPHESEYLDRYYSYTEADGRRFATIDATQSGLRTGASGAPWRGFSPASKGNHWKFAVSDLDRLDAEGRIYWPKKEGGWPRLKAYLDEVEGAAIQSIWTDTKAVNSQADERTDYPTQKPESLLERIIGASSAEGDLVLDCFVGSGTTAVVSEKLSRRWIACDIGRFAVHTTRKRLLSLPEVRPFVVQNLGKYERQLWQAAEFGEAAQRTIESYRRFILDLYKGIPITGYAWLHGLKGGRMVHIGAVDSPVSPGDLSQIAADFKKSVGTGKDAPKTNGVDVLGWDFAFELNEVAKQQAAQANIDVRFLRIPRDVMDKRAVEQGDVRFFELAALSVDVKQQGLKLDVTLTDFVIPPDDVPEDVQRAITHWEQWIDYWAVDWDYKGDTFHNQWQDYRTRKKRELKKSTDHTYDQPGDYTVVVKVIDILGNDTTKTIKVKVAGNGATKATPARAARPARSAR
jgi:adenine-specific DNA-methyltransferase